MGYLTDEKQIEEFKNGAAGALKYLYKNIKDLEIYTGESMNPDGAMGFMNYEEDGVTPYLIFFKHSLVENKV